MGSFSHFTFELLTLSLIISLFIIAEMHVLMTGWVENMITGSNVFLDTSSCENPFHCIGKYRPLCRSRLTPNQARWRCSTASKQNNRFGDERSLSGWYICIIRTGLWVQNLNFHLVFLCYVVPSVYSPKIYTHQTSAPGTTLDVKNTGTHLNHICWTHF